MERTRNKDCGSSWSCRSWRAGAPPQLVISGGGSMSPPPGSFIGLMSLHRRMKSELTTWTYMLAADGTTIQFFCKQNHAWLSIRYQHLCFINKCTYYACIYDTHLHVVTVISHNEFSFSNKNQYLCMLFFIVKRFFCVLSYVDFKINNQQQQWTDLPITCNSSLWAWVNVLIAPSPMSSVSKTSVTKIFALSGISPSKIQDFPFAI